MTLIQRRLNVDATSWRCIDVEATLYKRHVPAGNRLLKRYRRKKMFYFLFVLNKCRICLPLISRNLCFLFSARRFIMIDDLLFKCWPAAEKRDLRTHAQSGHAQSGSSLFADTIQGPCWRYRTHREAFDPVRGCATWSGASQFVYV